MTFIVDDNDHILWSFYHQNIWDVVESKIFKNSGRNPSDVEVFKWRTFEEGE